MDNIEQKKLNATEIGNLASQLNPSFQAYVLNTINTLLFTQQLEKSTSEKSKI